MRRKHSLYAVSVLTLLAISNPAALAADDQDPPPEETAEAGSFAEDLNLGFEASDHPEGWFAGGKGYNAAIDEEQKHTGKRSLRLAFREAGDFGVATSRVPVDAVKGKRLRLIGFIKTEEITEGWAGLWMRVDGPGGVLAFDNMQQRGITGTTGWTRYEIELDVAEEAVNINFGALLAGNGTVWVDSLSFEFAEPPEPPPTVTLRGVVNGPDGAPVAGAHVALVRPMTDRAAFRVRCDAEGRFSFDLPAGEYAVTATARGLTAAYVPPASFGPEEAADELHIPLSEGGFTIGGTVADETGKPVPGAVLRVMRISDDVADIFYTEADDQGRYELDPVPGDGFMIVVESDDHVASPVSAESGVDRVVDITLVRLGPAPDEVVAWVKGHAIPLETAEAEHGFEDMQPLKKLVGDARVVALGEATHGSREFFQLKHRMLEFLVEEMGFTVFAIEANWPECLAINDYVLEGKGDPKEALAGIYFWTWNTEEVLEQMEWMRRYNADTERERKVKFYGFDMQTPTVAAREAIAYLERMDPETAAKAGELLAPLEKERAAQSLQAMSEEDNRALADAVSDLLQRFDEQRATWVESSGEREWIVARQKVVLLEQILEMSSGGTFNARDEAMAANLEWILETEPPGTKVVVWAHNGHVSRSGSDAMQPMGSHLDRSLGDDYVVLGFVFNQGSFQAIDWTQGQGKSQGLIEHTVGPAPEGHLGAAFARAGMPIFVLDLRRIPAEGTVAGWFDVPHPMREIGAVFAGEEQMSHPVVLGDHYDGVIFVNETTRAQPVQQETNPSARVPRS
jgi:erythromycin esterase